MSLCDEADGFMYVYSYVLVYDFLYCDIQLYLDKMCIKTTEVNKKKFCTLIEVVVQYVKALISRYRIKSASHTFILCVSKKYGVANYQYFY